MNYYDREQIEEQLSLLSCFSNTLELALMAPRDEVTFDGHASLTRMATEIANITKIITEQFVIGHQKPKITLQIKEEFRALVEGRDESTCVFAQEMLFRKLAKIFPEFFVAP